MAELDRDGVIVAVNEAWEQFAHDNGGDPLRTGVGTSYLAVCDAAAADPGAEAVAEAVRSAIRGQLPAPLTVLVPCHAPGEQRFFDVLISSRTDALGACLGATVTLSLVDHDASPPPAGRVQAAEHPGPGDPLTQGRLRALQRVHAAVAGDLSLPAVLRHVVEAARDLAGARYAALGLTAAAGALSAPVHSGVDAAGAGSPRRPAPGDSSLEVPLRVRDQVLGNLYLSGSTRGGFSSEDAQLIAALATSAGLAIENARLSSQAAQERRWLESATELTARLVAGTSEDPWALALRQAVDCAAADAGRVVVVADERRGHVRAQIGSMGELPPGQTLDLGDSICGRILHEAKPLLATHDSEPLPSPRDPTAPTGVGAVAGVPLVAPDGEVLAALVVRRPPGTTPFDARDLGLLASFGTHAGLAVAQERARADRDSLLMLTEHDRIAADLHDHVIQELFAIGMGLHGLVHLQPAPVHQRRLTDYVESLDQTIQRIRSTIFQVTHRPHGPSSLRTRLMEVLDDERPALGYSAHIEFSGSLDLGVPEAIGDDVVAVLREALSNVARHAHARIVNVEVSLVGTQLEVAVTDDGVGIGHSDRSSGLANLRRRAESHQGTFRISSPPAGGTQLRWTASVEPPTA